MIVVPLPGLEDLTLRIESGLTDALREREQLGLSVPPRPRLKVMFYRTRNEKAFATVRGSERTIGINTAALWQPLLDEGERSDLETVMRYFDVARELIAKPSEETILSLLNAPEPVLSALESSMSEDALKRRQNYLSMRGTTYEQYREEIVRNAHEVKDTLAQLLPGFEKLAPNVDLSFIRHELDHIDFFSAPFSAVHLARKERADRTWTAFKQEEDALSRHEYAEALIDCLGSTTVSLPLLETRALFFDTIEPCRWDDADYDAAGSTVLWRFLTNYVEDLFLENLADTLTFYALHIGQMNVQTAHYVHQTTSYQRLDVIAAQRYDIWPPEVDFKEANRILYSEMPFWKAAMAHTAVDAVEVFAQAYRDDPSRLKRAMVARTPEEYLSLCRT